MGKFINPFVDTSFKLIFGRESHSEEFLIDFLNEIFRGDPDFEEIVSVSFGNSERIGSSGDDKKIIYDIHCTTSTGHRFIVEMQRQSQKHFRHRVFYYVSRMITDQVEHIREELLKNLAISDADQGKRRRNEYDYLPVVGVFICDFVISGFPQKVLIRSSMCDDETGKSLSRLQQMVFIQLPLFNKTEEESESGFEKWIYILKNMENLQKLPFEAYKDRIFRRLENVVDYAGMSLADREQYDRDMRFVRDYNETMAFQYDDGFAKGELRKAWDIAIEMKKSGMDLKMISQLTKLDIEELKNRFEV